MSRKKSEKHKPSLQDCKGRGLQVRNRESADTHSNRKKKHRIIDLIISEFQKVLLERNCSMLSLASSKSFDQKSLTLSSPRDAVFLLLSHSAVCYEKNTTMKQLGMHNQRRNNFNSLRRGGSGGVRSNAQSQTSRLSAVRV